MSAGITLSCDGHRSGQPCRGFLPTRAAQPDEARHVYGKPRGWRGRYVLEDTAPGAPTRYRVTDLCPSPAHDEDRHADDRPTT